MSRPDDVEQKFGVSPKTPVAVIAGPRLVIVRPHLMAGLYTIGVVNGLIGVLVAGTMTQPDILSAVYNTFGLNVVVLLACAIGVRLSLHGTPEPANATDLMVAAIFALITIDPKSSVSWIGITLLSLYDLVFRRAGACSTAAGSVFLAVSTQQLWGRSLANLLAVPLSVMDATLVAAVLRVVHPGVSRTGSVIDTGAGHSLAIMLGCSSFHNVSLGLLCWVAITRAARPSWQRSDLKAGAVIIAAIVGLNVTRLVLMGIDLPLYERVHSDPGATIFNLAVLMTALAVSAYGVRHELWFGCSSRRLDSLASGERTAQG